MNQIKLVRTQQCNSREWDIPTSWGSSRGNVKQESLNLPSPVVSLLLPFHATFVVFVKKSISIGKRTWPSLLKGNLKELQTAYRILEKHFPQSLVSMYGIFTYICLMFMIYGQCFTAKMPLLTRWNNLLTRNLCWSGKLSKTGAQGVLKLADFGLAREFVDLQMLGSF